MNITNTFNVDKSIKTMESKQFLILLALKKVMSWYRGSTPPPKKKRRIITSTIFEKGNTLDLFYCNSGKKETSSWSSYNRRGIHTKFRIPQGVKVTDPFSAFYHLFSVFSLKRFLLQLLQLLQLLKNCFVAKILCYF